MLTVDENLKVKINPHFQEAHSKGQIFIPFSCEWLCKECIQIQCHSVKTKWSKGSL